MAGSSDDGCSIVVLIAVGLLIIGHVLKVIVEIIVLIGWGWIPIIVTTIIILMVIRSKKERRRKEAQERKRKEEEAYKERKRKEEEAYKERMRKEEEAYKERMRKYGFYKLKLGNCELYTKYANAEIDKMVKKSVIVDTCIWMSHELDCFFSQLLHCCRLNNSKVTIPAAVYEEVNRLKSDYEKGNKAKIAFERIKRFTDLDALYIPGLKNVPNKKAYADKDLISLARKLSEGDQEFYLLTNDQELITRTKNLLSKRELCHFVSVEPTEFSVSQEAKCFLPSNDS